VRREQRRELGDDSGSHARVRPQCRQHPLPHRSEIVLRLGEEQSAQRAERLEDAVELQVAAELVELAGHEPAVAAVHDGPQLVDERGFAHPRRTADQHHTTTAGQRSVEGALQRRHLVVAAASHDGNNRSGTSRWPMRS